MIPQQNKIAENLLVVIPVFNHAATVAEVARRCLLQHPDVLVVDDGSTEDIAAALQGLDVKITRHDRNRGKGHAILTAARYASQHNKTHILTIDADGQHYPEQIPDFLKASAEQPGAVIIGVRDFQDSSAPLSSRFGRAFGNFWVKIQTGCKVHDIQSGYRVYPVAVLNSLRYMFHTYAFEDEVVVRACWAGVSVREIPVKVFYAAREDRVSHFHKFRENVRLTILNTCLTIRCIVPWLHLRMHYENGQFHTIRNPLHILKTQLAEDNTPLKLGLAGALGVVMGALPLIACHTIATLYAAACLRLNKIVAIATGHICIPPFVPALCIEVGYFLRFGRFLTLKDASSLKDATFLDLGSMGLQRIAEWFLGSLIVGPVLALITGAIIFFLSCNIRNSITWITRTKTQ